MFKSLLVLVIVLCVTVLTEGGPREGLFGAGKPLRKKSACNLRKEVHNKITYTLYPPYGLPELNKYDMNFRSADPFKPYYIFINGGFNEHYITHYEKHFAHVIDKKKQNLVFAKWMSSNDEPYLEGAVEVGENLANAIRDLTSMDRYDELKFTLVGHGYGAVVAGRAGNLVNGFFEESNPVIKIVALDPPLKLEELPSHQILNAETAESVHVIHTSIGDGGIEAPIGTLDFYPNGGSKQPHCDHNLSCNRDAAYKFYIEAAKKERDVYNFLQCSDMKTFEESKCDGNPIVNLFYNDNRAPEGTYFAKINLREKPNIK